MTRWALLIVVLLIGIVGCGGPGRMPEAGPVKGQVTFADGKPVKDVVLNLQPMEAGFGAALNIGPDGTFRGNLTPGKYAFYFSAQEARSDAERQKFAGAYKAIPEQYRSAHLDRSVRVKSGGEVQIKLN